MGSTRAEVGAAVEAAFERYDVRSLQVDPFLWRAEIAAWREKYGEDRVPELKTNNVSAWGEACELTYAAVVEGTLSHDGTEILDRHLRNAVPRTPSASKWATFGKIHPASPRKVDAAVALTLAIHAAHNWIAPPPPRTPFAIWL